MTKKIKVLNLYAGIGGNRKLWSDEHKITSVEFNKEIADTYKLFYPKDKVIVDDALKYLVEHWREFDFIWASPPCQTHSKMRYLASKRGSYEAKLPDLSLYELILFLQHFCKDKLWIVENVVPYYEPLIKPIIKIGRHLFWSNFDINELKVEREQHNNIKDKGNKYNIDLTGIKTKHRKDKLIRNCVHPEIALHILNCAINSQK